MQERAVVARDVLCDFDGKLETPQQSSSEMEKVHITHRARRI